MATITKMLEEDRAYYVGTVDRYWPSKRMEVLIQASILEDGRLGLRVVHAPAAPYQHDGSGEGWDIASKEEASRFWPLVIQKLQSKDDLLRAFLARRVGFSELREALDQ